MAAVRDESTFGKRVRGIRERQGIRQTDLALSAGLSWRHLIRIEKDEGGIAKPGTVARLAAALGVSERELTGEADDDEEAAMAVRREADLLEALRPLARLLSQDRVIA